MKIHAIAKSCLMALSLSVSLSAFASDTIHHNTTHFKQLGPQVAPLNQTVDTWEVYPPFDGWGFGVWSEDHRIQKMIIHVNNTLSNSDQPAAAVNLTCNGTSFIIHAGETVVCERSLDN